MLGDARMSSTWVFVYSYEIWNSVRNVASGADLSLNMEVNGVSQVKPSNCFRHLENLSFTFHRWHKRFIRDDVKLAVIRQQFWVKECDIFFFFLGGGQNILRPLLHIFRGSRPPQPPRSTPLNVAKIFTTKSYCTWYRRIHGVYLGRNAEVQGAAKQEHSVKLLQYCLLWHTI